MNWDDLRFFVALARAGSLSEAARRLAADHTTVARRVGELEQALGLKLFDRMPRGWVPTAEGAALAERAADVEAAIHAVARFADGRSETIDGRVSISAPPALASLWLAPRLAPLTRAHPGLTLDLIGDVADASLVRREADVALRLRQPSDSGLIGRRIGDLRYGLYGARDLVEATAGEDLDFLGYDERLDGVPQQLWLRERARDRRIALVTNDLVTLLTAVRAGMGLAALPHVLAAADDGLVCLEEAEAATRPIWLVVHPDLRRSARIRAVMDHLIEVTAPLRRPVVGA